MKLSLSHFKKGFTLVELLVVISVIGVLSALLVANFVGVRERAGDASKKANLRQLKTALRLYYNDYQRYPAQSGVTFAGCGAAGTSNCSPGGEFSAGAGGTVYMKQLPTDYFYYDHATDVNRFLLRIVLDNPSDGDIQTSQSKCSPGDFGVTPGTSDYFVCED